MTQAIMDGLCQFARTTPNVKNHVGDNMADHRLTAAQEHLHGLTPVVLSERRIAVPITNPGLRGRRHVICSSNNKSLCSARQISRSRLGRARM